MTAGLDLVPGLGVDGWVGRLIGVLVGVRCTVTSVGTLVGWVSIGVDVLGNVLLQAVRTKTSSIPGKLCCRIIAGTSGPIFF